MIGKSEYAGLAVTNSVCILRECGSNICGISSRLDVIFRRFTAHGGYGVEFVCASIYSISNGDDDSLLLGIVRNKHPFENRQFSCKGKFIFMQRKLNPLSFGKPQMNV